MSASTPISPEMQKAARQAVRPAAAVATASPVTTPSWTSIVEAYHKEGNGDREMLLALLQAKAKEDERLAAMDLLKAEQMRAYSAHLAVHGPMYGAHPHMAHYAYPQHPHQQQQHGKPMPTLAVASMAVSLPSPAPTATSSSSRRVSASSSTSAAKSSSSSSSKHKKSASRGSDTASTSRSRAPSLTNSVSSAGSSPASPAEGTLLLSLSAAAASIASSSSSTKPRLEDAQKVVLTAGELYGSSALKRRRSDDDDAVVSIEDQHMQKRSSPVVASKRLSPVLPGIASFDQYKGGDGKGMQHILNADLRLSNSTRMATSDVRSSSASDME